MLKGTIKKSVASCMALLVLVSTMSFTINEHYCGEMLMDSAIFNKADTCGMEMTQQVPTKNCQTVKNNNCCKDVVMQHAPSEVQIDVSTLAFNQQVFIAAFVHTYKALFKGVASSKVHFKHYLPPILIEDLQVFNQTFLI